MKEGLVFSAVYLRKINGPTNRKSVIIFMIRGRWATRGCRGSVSRIEIAVAHDLENITVKGIRARSKLVGRHSLGQSILSRKRRGQNTELTHHLERRVDIRLQALRFRLGDSHSVKHHLILEVQTTVDTVAETTTGHPWHNEQKVVNLPSTRADVRAQRQRKFVYNFGFERRPEFRLRSLQGDRLRYDFDILSDAAWLENGVRTGVPTDFDKDVVAHRGGKPSFFGLDGVGARDQVGDSVGAGRTGDGGTHDTPCGVGDSNLGVRNHCAGLISDSSGDAAESLGTQTGWRG